MTSTADLTALKNTDAPPAPWETTAASAIHSGKRRAIRDYISTLDPERDCQEISYLLSCYEFPWDTTRALEFALFRVFGVAKGSPLLVQTGEFVQRTQKRYDDTVLILSEILESGGYDTPRGQAALVRMNKQHGRFKIPNDEFLYTLSTFILEPIRWNETYGWRPLTEPEKQASYFFWREIGRRMGIRTSPKVWRHTTNLTAILRLPNSATRPTTKPSPSLRATSCFPGFCPKDFGKSARRLYTP